MSSLFLEVAWVPPTQMGRAFPFLSEAVVVSFAVSVGVSEVSEEVSSAGSAVEMSPVPVAASEAESSGSSPGAAISVTPSRGVSVGFSSGSWGAVSSGSSVEEVPAGSSWVFSDDVSSVFSDGASEKPPAGSSSEGSGSVPSFTASVKAVSSIYCSSCS